VYCILFEIRARPCIGNEEIPSYSNKKNGKHAAMTKPRRTDSHSADPIPICSLAVGLTYPGLRFSENARSSKAPERKAVRSFVRSINQSLASGQLPRPGCSCFWPTPQTAAHLCVACHNEHSPQIQVPTSIEVKPLNCD
jgi:hypothetical protein